MPTYTAASTLTWINDYDRHGQNNTDFQQTGRDYVISKVSYLSNPNALPDAFYVNGEYTGQNRGTHSDTEGPVVVVRNWTSTEEAQFFVDFMIGLCTEYNVPITSAVVEPI
jgi:hypothetical protein